MRKESPVYQGYRANRTRSLYNVDDNRGATFELDVDLPIESEGWKIGLVVGPSGSGKTSIGQALAEQGFQMWNPKWPKDKPIIEAITPKGDYDAAAGALSAVGLGDVPAWLRPHSVLSMGEQFRANLGRLVAEKPDRVVVDEFTSVVDRQIAKVGSMAFAKSWRRGGGQVVVLSCHRDIVEWLAPDWVFDTDDGSLRTECLWQRPDISVEVVQVGWKYWPHFSDHHYLTAGPMPFGTGFVGFVGQEPVVHIGMSGKTSGKGRREARACRMVVMPEWQGAGVGMKVLNWLCERELQGTGFIGKKATTLMHTAHPGLVFALRRDPRWRQVSAVLGSSPSSSKTLLPGLNWGGHFRPVAGFRYGGQAYADAVPVR